MTITVPQTRIANNHNANSLALSFASTPTVGSRIVVYVSSYAGDLGTSAVTDNQGNTYTRIGYLSDPVEVYLAIYTAIASTSSGTFTVTANPSGTSADITLVIAEVAGAATGAADVTNSATGTGTAVSSGNVTPGEAGEILIAAMTHTGSTRTLTEESGWTLAGENQSASGSQPINAVYKIQTTATTEDADWTISASETWLALIASFKAAASGVSGTLSVTLGALTSSATGTIAVKGTASPTLATLTLSSAGAVSISGQAAIALGVLTASATGAVAITGATDSALGALTGAATGAVAVNGAADNTLDALTLSAAGVVDSLPAISGAADVTLEGLTVTGAGVVPIVGEANQILTGLTLSSSGKVATTGQAANTLTGFAIQAAGKVLASGLLSAALEGLSLQGIIFMGVISTPASRMDMPGEMSRGHVPDFSNRLSVPPAQSIHEPETVVRLAMPAAVDRTDD